MTSIRIVQAASSVQTIEYRAPMKFGGRVVTEATLLDVEATVETSDRRRSVGAGSMPLSNVWAWPSREVPPETALRAMRQLGEQLVESAAQSGYEGHPLEVCHALGKTYREAAERVGAQLELAEPIPPLAQLVAASPLEAAVYDAYGKAFGANTYNLLGPDYVRHDLAHYLNAEFSGEYLDRYTLRQPKPEMPLYHLVGALDPLTDADVEQRLGDGLPETLAEWIEAEGLTHLKIKLAGDDLRWDVDRVAAVQRVAAAVRRPDRPPVSAYSLDFNERCPNVDYVLDFLAQLAERSPQAYERVQYIEQPTHRDLRAHAENRMHRAAALKPVVIDESLVDFESLLLAREQGYSGVALKACKGQTEALLMGAAAQKYGLYLCVQDLTCPGRSFLHSASLAARIPTVAAIEGNARQYCPAGNAGWSDRYPSMFRITRGTLGTACLDGPGLW